MIIIVVVICVTLLLVVVAILVYKKSGGGGGGHTTNQRAVFENPVYVAQGDPPADAEGECQNFAADDFAGDGQPGYMDVAPDDPDRVGDFANESEG
jgi:hypothetical protein